MTGSDTIPPLGFGVFAVPPEDTAAAVNQIELHPQLQALCRRWS